MLISSSTLLRQSQFINQLSGKDFCLSLLVFLNVEKNLLQNLKEGFSDKLLFSGKLYKESRMA